MEALELAIKYATDAKIDPLTVDGSCGGTGVSPWSVMETRGVTPISLRNNAYEYASILAEKKKRVVDLPFAGGLTREDHIFKALSLGAPFVRLICMSRSMMVPRIRGQQHRGRVAPRPPRQGVWSLGIPSPHRDRNGPPT